MTHRADTVDITFIGAGPSGLYGAYYAGLHGLSTRIIEALPQLGGQLAALYPEKYIYDVGGFPKVLAKELVANLIEQAMQYNPEVRLGERVEELVRGNPPDEPFLLKTDSGAIYPTKTVVITAGIGAFSPRKLDAPGIEEFEGKGVYYTVGDASQFAGASVLVIGGGDSAVDWALMLEKAARQVTLIHRRAEFRAHTESVNQLMRSKVDVKVHHELRSLHGDGRLQRAVIFDNRDNSETELDVDAVVCALGFTPNLGPLKEWGIEIVDDCIPVKSTCETNIPGVFAAGDIATYPGKLKLIASGFGEAATAVGQAKRVINPKARIHIHSTNVKPPAAKMS